MKRGRQKRAKKHLSASGLLRTVRSSISGLDKVKADASKNSESLNNSKESENSKKARGRPRAITKSDCAMSAIAMFSLKSPSLLDFDTNAKNPRLSHNLRTLFGIKQVPCDTYMREELDTISPRDLRGIFINIFDAVRRGGLLSQYEFLGGYLLALDGSGIFESNEIHCENCCEKHHKKADGTTSISYHHQIFAGALVYPGLRQVIPFCPEPILKQDGATKNDCESAARYRFLEDLHREHPRLKLTLTLDALHANAPAIYHIEKLGYSYIIAVQPGSHKNLFEWTKGILNEITMKVGKNTYHFRYVNNVPLNDTKDAPNVNFLDCEAIEVQGKKEIKRRFTWIVDRKITEKNIEILMRGGRTKWKIENETFNTLKNQGYQLEHNFGHGTKYLSSIFATLMMAAFLVDQIQEAACGLWQAALAFSHSRRALWEHIRSIFYWCFVKTWEDLFSVLNSTFEGFTINST